MPFDVQEIYFSARGDPSVILHGYLLNPTSSAPKQLVCVFVHPWGLLGGSQGNTYPYAELLCDRFGYRCLIFNCRGVGMSTGKSSFKCFEEITDVLGACDWVESNLRGDIVLVGSSAGAAVAGSALDRVPRAVAYVGIGYTFGWCSGLVLGGHYEGILKSTKPKLFIMGTDDGFTTVTQLESRVQSMENATMKLVKGVGHFALERSLYAARTCEYISDFMVNIGSEETT